MVSRIDESRILHGLGDDAQGDEVEARAAIAHGQAEAQKAQLGHLGQHFVGEGVGAVVFLDDGHDFFAGEVIGHLFDHFVFFG